MSRRRLMAMMTTEVKDVTWSSHAGYTFCGDTFAFVSVT